MHGHSKLRIHILKMQRKKLHLLLKDKATTDADERNNGGTRFKCGGQFSRKSVGSAFSCVLGNKTPSPLCNHASSRVKRKDPLGDSGNGKSLALEDAPSQLVALDGGAGEGKKDRQREKMNLPFLGKGWNNFMRDRFSGDVHGDGNDVVTGFGQVRIKASLRHLVRIRSKILVIRLKLKSLIKKKKKKQFEPEAGDDENEGTPLWRKRILMGERCRPLSSPGYDTYNFYFSRAQRNP